MAGENPSRWEGYAVLHLKLTKNMKNLLKSFLQTIKNYFHIKTLITYYSSLITNYNLFLAYCFRSPWQVNKIIYTIKSLFQKGVIKNTSHPTQDITPQTKKFIDWMDFSSDTRFPLITQEVLTQELNKFFIFYEANFPNYNYFAILPIITLKNGDLRSWCKVQVSTLKDFNILLNSLSANLFSTQNFNVKMSASDDELFEDIKYKDYIAGKIIFRFKPSTLATVTKYSRWPILEDNKPLKSYSKSLDYKGVKIPTTMDLTLWPNISLPNDSNAATSYYELDRGGNKTRIDFIIEMREKESFVTVNSNNETLFSFRDVMNNPSDLSDFTRTIIKEKIILKEKNITHILNKVYYCFDGEAYFTIEDLKKNFIKAKETDKNLNDKILTLDLETKTIEGKMVPICMSIFDGKETKSFIFQNHDNWSEDMLKAMKSILIRKYFDYKIYVHNFSYFDAIFMLDTLSKLGTLKPLTRGGKILQLKLSFNTFDNAGKSNKKKGNITFYDSYLLLPSGLDALSKSFNIENKKTFFPFSFINDNELNYSGAVPDRKHFPNISDENYQSYLNSFKDKVWDLRKELAIYCENDTIALHQIITAFSKEIFKLFKVDITKYPTLPSVAFGYYRAKHLPQNTIPIILGKDYELLQKAYYGGITDSYRPFGKNIHSYDVNSLYPAAMKSFPMPVGHPRHFIGDPYLIDKNPFGFFEVKVTAPDIKIPFLPTKMAIGKATRTICPKGTWSGWYFSEEIKNAQKHGYRFEILQGYLFQQKNIFDTYVSDLYHLKSNTDPSNPRYFIAKLLMNSLYGRFGMDPINEVTSIVSQEESEKLAIEKDGVLPIPLLSGNVLVKYESVVSENSKESNVSVPISAAIASYSRIMMSYYLVKYADNIYAIDTDGIKLDCHLHPDEVHNKDLGKMKYEYTFKEAVFPLPKVYGGILENPYKGKTEIVKIKGVKIKTSYDFLKSVLFEGSSLVISQEKWKRMIPDSSILITASPYTLSLNDNKRELIFDNGKLVDTMSIKLKDGKVVRESNDNSKLK